MASLTYANEDYYLAGVFDGEGTVGVYHRDVNHDGQYRTRVVVSVAMCDEPPVRAFYERYGGGFMRDRSTITGRPVYKWYHVGAKAKDVLMVFAALCRAKAAQARLALEAIVLIEATKHRARRKRITPEENRRRGEIAVEIAALKRVA